MTYTVTLVGWQHAGKADIQAAEQRFRALLEAELGSKVPEAYRAWFEASSATHDTPQQDWPADERRAIDRWDRIYVKATREALERLPGKGSEPWFDVQLNDAS